MKNILSGDTILFKTTAHDNDGTALTSAIVTLFVTDFAGSTVFNSIVPHETSGTYQIVGSTVGWGNGPGIQNWTIEDGAGTVSRIKKNEFKIVSSEVVAPSYVSLDELQGYYPSIKDYITNQSEDQVVAAYKYTNRILDGLGYNTPVPESDDSLYDQSARDHNAWDAIYRIIKSDQVDKTRKDESGNYWFDEFRESADRIYKDWKSLKITFKRKVSPGEAGIGLARRTQGSTAGSMYNNHDEMYGSGFEGSDYERNWSVEITGTGTSGGLRECTYKWSNDDGIGTTDGTITDAWTHLDQQVYVRFTRGTSSLITGLFTVGDRWEWKTNPTRNQTGGKNVAHGYG